MKDILAKLAALSAPEAATGKKNLKEGIFNDVMSNAREPLDFSDEREGKDQEADTFKRAFAPSKWEQDTRGMEQDSDAGLGEAGGPPGMSGMNKVYPDTKEGVLQYMQYGYDKSFLKRLDLPTCNIHADPSVDGVWAVDSMASGFRCVIYLAGYNDPWGQKRIRNDNEEGGFTMSYMKKLVERDSLSPKLMKHWVKCGSLEPSDMEKLIEWHSVNFGESVDEATLGGPTQKYNEPDEPYSDDDENLDYCPQCDEPVSPFAKSCPHCGAGGPEQDMDESVDDWKDSAGAVADAITHRITRQRLDLLRQYGPEAVMNAIDEVSEFVGDVDEIGSSDVSAWVKSVERALASFAKTGGMAEGAYGDDGAEWEPPWEKDSQEDERDPDTMRGGHDDLDEANTLIDPHELGLPSVADNKKWKVTWWVEEKAYGDEPGREYEDWDVVSAPTEDEAFQIIKNRPKQTGRMRYGFKVAPAQERDLHESHADDERDERADARYGNDTKYPGEDPNWKWDGKSKPARVMHNGRWSDEKKDKKEVEEGYAQCEGAKVDRMVGHIKKSEKKLGKSSKDAENIAWATANKRGMLDNKNKKTNEADPMDRRVEINAPLRKSDKKQDAYYNTMKTKILKPAVKGALGKHTTPKFPQEKTTEGIGDVVSKAIGGVKKFVKHQKNMGKANDRGWGEFGKVIRHSVAADQGCPTCDSEKRASHEKKADQAVRNSNRYHDFASGGKGFKSTKSESVVTELSPETHKNYQAKADVEISQHLRSGDKEKMGKRAAGFARSLDKLPMQKKTRAASLQTEGKNMTKKTINESVDFGNAPPELVKILRHFGKEVADFQQGGELHDNLYDALYDYYFDDMPYGTKKARTGDPYEWIADRLDRDITGAIIWDESGKDEHNANDPFDMDDPAPGINQPVMPKEGMGGDIMPLESIDSLPDDEWYDTEGALSSDGAYDAGGHYDAERDAGRNDYMSAARREEFMGLGDSVDASLDVEPQPGEEVITELSAPDEAKITDMLSNIGLDHGLDFWFEGNEIVVIGRTTARLVTNTVGGHIQSVDGEEFRIGMKPRAPKAVAPKEIDDLAAVPELGEGKMSELDIERKEKREKAAKEAREKKAKEAKDKKDLKEEVSADDVELLTMQYKSGQLSYDEFREKLDDLEYTDSSMRQGEMGLQGGDTPAGNRAWDDEAHDWSDDGVEDGEAFEGEFANSAEEPAQPEVHTSTTQMINQGDDLNRPKKQSYPLRNPGDNPMAEARSLMRQYQLMKADVSK